LKTYIAILLSLALTGCVPESTDDNTELAFDTAYDNTESVADGNYTVTISEDEAKRSAMFGLDEDIYSATSTIVGPLQYRNEWIPAYEVTVNGGDHIILRYIDGNDGTLLQDIDAYHEIPTMNEVDLPEDVMASYYTSCPSGWPLCIANPSSITFYSQNDPSWKYDLLGNSSTSTIGGYGCLLSSYAMEICKNGHGCYTPKQLNAYKTCFSGDLVINSCIASKVGASYSTISLASLWGKIASGVPVVVYGKSSCMGGSYHAQMIWGHDGSRYWTKDPWYDWTNQDQAMCVSSPSYRVIH
jgi:hypothetical protein